MFGAWSFPQEEIDDAKNIIERIDKKICKIEDLVRHIVIDCGGSEDERDKIRRLKISRKCIVYYYSL